MRAQSLVDATFRCRAMGYLPPWRWLREYEEILRRSLS
jgi:hypothetical protein